MNECASGCVVTLANITSKGFESVARNFEVQAKYNRKVALFSAVATACIIMMYRKIERLSDEVKELKQPMEE